MFRKIIPVLIILIYLTGFLLSFPYIFDKLLGAEKLESIRNIFEYGIMFASFLVFNALLFKNKYTTTISVVLCILLSLNFLISVSCFLIYHSGFNVGMAISILETNVDEAMSMSYMFIFPCILFLAFLGLLLYSVNSLKNIVAFNTKYTLIALLWLIMPFTFFLKHKYISNKGGGKMIKNVYYHLSDFNVALKIQDDINTIKQNVPVFNIKKIQPGIENVILIIGESERKQNMSLYGYPKKTTPYTDQEANNMMIFDHAVSPAGITNLSVPLILSSIHPDEYRTHFNKLSNNVINMSNQAGYNSFWLSTQASARGITAMASLSKNKKWINGYDEAIIPELKNVVQKNGENKFIVLHIMGSHPNPCNRLPPNWNSGDLDCYDSSIKYTDYVFKGIFNALKNTNSVVIYASDHGLKIQNDKLLHIDSKESTQVPFFLWYGDKIPAGYKTTGREAKLTQTTYIYPLIMKYMGLEMPLHYKNEENKYLDLEMRSINYNQLPE